MRRLPVAAVVITSLVSPDSDSGLRAAGVGQAPGPEFEVASIKRNTSPTPTPGPPPNPAGGQITLTWLPARFLATRAYPDLTTPLVVEGLPAWADSERYDVTVRFRPGATAAAQAAMWNTLLADRMKLRAHYESRSRAGYTLVLARADGRLGPQIRPSTIDCPPVDPAKPAAPNPVVREIASTVLSERRAPNAQEEATLMSQCGASGINDRLYAGSTDIKGLMQSIAFLGRLDGPITDATGLDGRYSIKLWTSRATAPLTAAAGPAAEPALDEAPPLFTALQDQLGLKLERTTIEGKVLVVDHIERPTEN
jgi:uncharacterized protein (TIGR03435 family)